MTRTCAPQLGVYRIEAAAQVAELFVAERAVFDIAVHDEAQLVDDAFAGVAIRHAASGAGFLAS